MRNFVHLHNHTEYSFLDGAARIKDMVKRTVKWDMPALAITDHGGLFGAVEFYDTCIKEGIKPVIGFEAYVAPGSRKERKSVKGSKSYSHLVLFAKNDKGWKNLMKLSSIGYLEGFYYKPRIDKEVLREYSEGIIGTSACLAGEIPQALLAGDQSKAKNITEEYLKIFGEGNFYFELMNHGIDDEIVAFNEMINLGNSMGVPLIVTNDSHYLDKADAESHEVLLCLQTQAKLTDKDHFSFTTDEMYFKSPDEMAALFPDQREAMKNTIELAEKCSIKIHAKPQLPVPEIPSGFEDPEQYLRRLAEEGMQERYREITDRHRKQLDYELKIICSMGFSGYFLIVRDFVLEAERRGVMHGCRGSAAGSLVAYCLGITEVDPVKFDLIFERFLNPERVSMPDADIDFADHDRYKIIDYVVNKYGRESVCQIINFGRMKAKMIVRDVGRVLDVPLSEVNRLASLVNEKNLELSIKNTAELKEMIDNNRQYQELFRHARVLEGLARQPGMHAGGVIIAPGPVTKWSRLFKQKSKGEEVIMTQFDMGYVESVGLIKMDFLGLRTLTVLQEAVNLIEYNHKKKIELRDIEDHDSEVFELFGKGETTSIFQFESQGMKDYLRKLKPTCVEDLIAMNALYRPGPMENIDTFIHRKHGREKIEYPHEMLKDVLDVTYGIIVYQEQVMRIAQHMGGFTLGQADILRKAISKKKADTMEELKVRFLKGAQEKKIDKKTAKNVWDQMEKFGLYGFNKAHATAYAHLAYQAGFLKTYYKKEYMTAVLTSRIGDKDQFLTAKNEAERMGIAVLPPDVNRSEYECSIENDAIRLGLGVIANVGKASEAVIDERKKNGEYSSIFDVCRRVDLHKLNKKSLESLICAGALESLPGHRAQLIDSIETAVEYGKSFQKGENTGQTDLFSFKDGDTDSEVFSVPEPALAQTMEWSGAELLAREKDVLNFYISGHPLEKYRDELEGFCTSSLSSDSLDELGANAKAVFGGLITSEKLYTQRNGKQMAFMQLEDFSGTIELLVFGDAYEKYNEFLGEDKKVLVKGVLKKEEHKKTKLQVEKVIALENARETLTRSIHIRINTTALEEAFLREVFDCCMNRKGKSVLIIHIVTKDNNEYKLKSSSVLLDWNRDTIELLRDKLGEENVWLGKNSA